ncbi:MAG TPA: hypothetical protein VFR09_07745 [Alphaproteobacteria bacterium]|nr:hypothetical protein [Alphaproteobacteria bacterium]
MKRGSQRHNNWARHHRSNQRTEMGEKAQVRLIDHVLRALRPTGLELTCHCGATTHQRPTVKVEIVLPDNMSKKDAASVAVKALKTYYENMDGRRPHMNLTYASPAPAPGASTGF